MASESSFEGVPEFLQEAQRLVLEAKAAQHKAEAQKALHEAESARIEAAKSSIDLERAHEKRERELVADDRHYIYRFVGEVSSATVRAAMDELTIWSRRKPGADITIIFFSPGGDVVSGMAFWDFLQELRSMGHHLTTVARGYAASMAGILLQAGDERVIGRESWLLIHEASFGVAGSYGEVADRVEWIKRIQDRILEIFANRSKLGKSAIKNRWHRKDWWLSSDEALKLGFVDRIA
jgi:ATP-dependent Clp endopeptidase proteolytic subunit ClpP